MAWGRTRRHEPCHEGGPDYAIVTMLAGGSYFVSLETAARVSEQLDRWWMPRWVRFVDVGGRRVWVRGREVDRIEENTAGQRLRLREFHDACTREYRASQEAYDEDDADPPGAVLPAFVSRGAAAVTTVVGGAA